MNTQLKIVSILALVSLGGLLFALHFYPEQALLYFWNLIIPIVPLVLFLSAGFWRNVCPLGFISQVPQLSGLKKTGGETFKFTSSIFYISLGVLLFAIVARKFWFNTNAELLIVLILLLAVAAITFGVLYEGKSGWCNGLCPLYTVEKFYGQNPLYSVKNCFVKEKESKCLKCSTNCIDIKNDKKITIDLDTRLLKKEHLFSAIFPGFIFGYFMVEDYPVIPVYQIFFEIALFTLVSVFVYRLFLKRTNNAKLLTMSSSAITLNIYYLFTIYNSFDLFFPSAEFGWTLLVSGILNVLLIIYSINWVMTYYLESMEYEKVKSYA